VAKSLPTGETLHYVLLLSNQNLHLMGDDLEKNMKKYQFGVSLSKIQGRLTKILSSTYYGR